MKLGLGKKIQGIFSSKPDREEMLLHIEELLITSDFGIDFTREVIDELGNRINKLDKTQLISELKSIISNRMAASTPPSLNGFTVFLVFGVNGSGKTTSVAKIAYSLKKEGKKVLVAAADTYRDAAIDQLLIWCRKADVPVIHQEQGADPGAVVFDACEAAQKREVETLIIDTAGRLHNKERLMEELAKINRIVEKKLPFAKKIKLLTLDATTGQNAISQASIFNQYVGVDGILLTKLDSSAKGGIVCAVSGKLGIPVLYLGTGEKVEDLIPFDHQYYLHQLFS